MSKNKRHRKVQVVSHRDKQPRMDTISIEEPIEFWVVYRDKNGDLAELSLSITMRTPGDDLALATGFLFAEGIIRSPGDIEKIEFFGPVTEPLHLQNQVRIYLRSGERMAEKNFQRYFYSNSSCGVCGKSSIQALEMLHEPDIDLDGFRITENRLMQLPDSLRLGQREFHLTGGLQGAALVDTQGEILHIMEDIGRHNALDKLIGQLLLKAGAEEVASGQSSDLETRDKMLLVSGRASYELVQKALMADVSFFASIGAPSSAAVDLANTFGMTLVGFLSHNDYNVYNQAHRILGNVG
jgi:FdhD protein